MRKLSPLLIGETTPWMEEVGQRRRLKPRARVRGMAKERKEYKDNNSRHAGLDPASRRKGLEVLRNKMNEKIDV